MRHDRRERASVSAALVANSARYYIRQRRWAALARALFLTVVLQHGWELCQECGRSYGRWSAPTPLWLELMGTEHGILCPGCFDAKATDERIRLTWVPMVAARDGVPTSNWWADPVRDRLLMGEPDPSFVVDDKVRDPQPPWGEVGHALGWQMESYYPAENRVSA